MSTTRKTISEPVPFEASDFLNLDKLLSDEERTVREDINEFMRASVQSELHLEDCRLPSDAILPEAKGLRGPFACLNEARYGIVWGAMGAARDCFECALEYSKGREQFGKPVAGFQ